MTGEEEENQVGLQVDLVKGSLGLSLVGVTAEGCPLLPGACMPVHLARLLLVFYFA